MICMLARIAHSAARDMHAAVLRSGSSKLAGATNLSGALLGHMHVSQLASHGRLGGANLLQGRQGIACKISLQLA